MSQEALQIIIAGALVAIPCGLLGCYLILRQMAMVGDAISHAVLPGIVIAFLISGEREPISMLLGAGVLGILTTFLIEFFHRKARLQTDASIGVTFTWLFAMGIILITAFAGQVDLDQDCVLYGEIAYVPIDLWITADGTIMGPRVMYIMGVVFVVVLVFIILGYKELFLTTFDPKFAAATGISVALWHYLLMGAVSFTTVGAFESVGAILVVALLIVPPATAYLLTENFKTMMWITAGLGIIISFLGYYLAAQVDGSIAGAMSLVAGVLFGLAFLFAPQSGLIAKRVKKSTNIAALGEP